jgi:hypothetical protein
MVPRVDAFANSELAPHDVRATARVNDPVRRDRAGLVLLGHVDGVLVGAELHVLNAPAAERVGAGLASAPEQLVLEPPAVDLVGERVEVAGRAELNALGDVRVVARRHVEPQAQLALLELLQVVAHADDLAVVIGADLDAGLADLEGRLGRGLGALVGDKHAGLRPLALELDRDRQPRQAAAEDGYVVVPVRRVNRLELQHRRRSVISH